MFTVSCYAFHPLILRFVRLWKYVQVVSDVLTCLLSMLCCQCVDMMPVPGTDSENSVPTGQVFRSQLPKNQVDPEKASGDIRRPQSMVIDYTEDTPEFQTKRKHTSQSVHKDHELQGIVNPVQQRLNDEEPASTSRYQNSREKNIIPSVHFVKKVNKKMESQCMDRITPSNF
ncbi:uncharacterized protein LOC142974529 [Anticarsia gemmatalis]|uniref:uncharacterized protein LOC142974529 n=1 Tax=Anticarsia gemmatalis TaxID=129554 RepID=UPI003F76F6C4